MNPNTRNGFWYISLFGSLVKGQMSKFSKNDQSIAGLHQLSKYLNNELNKLRRKRKLNMSNLWVENIAKFYRLTINSSLRLDLKKVN